jgi:hypothetical protein
MPDDVPQTPDDTAAARTRRRSSRPWSNPAPAEPAIPEPTPGEDEWASRRRPAPPRGRPPLSPPILPTTAPPAADVAPPDLSPLLERLEALQTQVSALQEAPAKDDAAISGEELTATIEALGNALGGGMATLLTEHRNLLARDVSQAADRILDEVGVRLRSSTTAAIEGVEERVRALVARSVGELVEQVDLRLDKVQADVAGLRAVMLDLPDQSGITDRIDELAESVANAKSSNRVTPAMSNAIEKAMAGPIEQIEANVHTVVDVVRELLDERLPGGMPISAEGGPAMPDAAAIEALTTEMTALRRRISLRIAAEEPAPDEEGGEIAVTKAAPRSRGRRSRQIED